LRLHYTTGLTDPELDDLTTTVEPLLPTPWNKPNGRPKKLTLRLAVALTCAYVRHNIIQEVLAEFFDVSQENVSRAITLLTPLLAKATEPHVPTPEDAADATRDRVAIVDGGLAPCWSWAAHRELWAGKQKTTGHNFQAICDTNGRCIYISDPLPGSFHDAKAVKTDAMQQVLGSASTVVGDKAYIGFGYLTPVRKPVNGELTTRDLDYNAKVSSIRAAVERVIAHIKAWRIVATDYRRPLRTFRDTFDLVRGLFFYVRSFE
jgi:hypothetical protein